MASTKNQHSVIAPAVVAEVDRRLRMYGTPTHHNQAEPLDELVFIILSAQTEEYLYLRTYKELANAFPGWEGLAEAPTSHVEEMIRAGGLFRRKARQLKAALARVVADAGRPTLDFLREWDDQRVYQYLTSLPGVSRKTALCIMMYSLGRAVFPVDTHVWRVARRLGWTVPRPKPAQAQERDLEAMVPPGLRYTLHVNMVAHGRMTCLTYWPKCATCVLAYVCPSRDKPDVVWGDWRRPGGNWANALTTRGSTVEYPEDAVAETRSLYETNQHESNE
jgi:endonuclease III